MPTISPASDPKDIAIAAGAIITGLIDTLIEKGILTSQDAHKIMVAALANTVSKRAHIDGPGAASVTSALARAYAAKSNV
jgi:hypothetical protein